MAETTKTRKSRDYSKGMIYIIRSVNPTTGQVYTYIGSTVSFDNRKNGHKSTIYNQNSKKYNLKLYKTIRENDGDWTMSKFKLFPCNSKIELEIEEERCRRGINASLNDRACSSGIDYSSMTPQEYQQQYNQQYREQNPEYHEQYYQQNREQKREYYEQNREQKCEYQRKYNKKNRDKINAKQREKRRQNKNK